MRYWINCILTLSLFHEMYESRYSSQTVENSKSTKYGEPKISIEFQKCIPTAKLVTTMEAITQKVFSLYLSKVQMMHLFHTKYPGDIHLHSKLLPALQLLISIDNYCMHLVVS